MAKLILINTPKPKLTPEEMKKIAEGLGAEYVGTIPKGGSPLVRYLTRQEAYRRFFRRKSSR